MNLLPFAIGTLRAHWKLIAGIGAIIILSLYAWRVDSLRASYKAERDNVRMEYALFRKEITARTAAALAKEKEKARAADKSHVETLADVRDATDRFIAANRVRKAGSGYCPAPTAPSAGLPEEVPTVIVVDQADVRACGDLYAYALEAHRWALSLDKVE